MNVFIALKGTIFDFDFRYEIYDGSPSKSWSIVEFVNYSRFAKYELAFFFSVYIWHIICDYMNVNGISFKMLHEGTCMSACTAHVKNSYFEIGLENANMCT